MSVARNHKSGVVKSAGAGGEINNREAQVAHRRCFHNLMDEVQKGAGLPGDQVPYWDPMGFLNSRGEALDLKTPLFKKYQEAFETFNRMQREGHAVKDAAEEVSKQIGTTSYSMPIFFTPDVFITDEEDTPLADMMARTAVQENQIKVDEITETGDAASFAEPSGGGETWPENDDTTANLTYDVVSYGRQNSVTDFLQLSASTLRSHRALTEEQQVRAIRQYEEAQLIVGKGNVDTGVTANDSSGFDGLTDLAASEGNTTDAAGATITIDDVRRQIESLRRNGTARDNILHVTDHKTFRDLHTDLTDFTRYESPGAELDFGFETLMIDGTPVMESHGSPYTDGERLFTSFDASAHYMGMLQDVTMHPLARDSPQEQFATDAYGTLVSESPSRVEVTHNLA